MRFKEYHAHVLRNTTHNYNYTITGGLMPDPGTTTEELVILALSVEGRLIQFRNGVGIDLGDAVIEKDKKDDAQSQKD